MIPKSLKERLLFKGSRKDLSTLIFWRDVFCEFIVCSFLMTVVILILVTNNKAAYVPNTTHFGLFAGFFVYMLLEGYGGISCLGHPPATLGHFLAGNFSFAKTVLYTASQILGTAVGSGIGYGLTPPKSRNYVAFNPADNGLEPVQMVFVEAVLTFNVMFIIFTTHGSDFPRKFPILPNLAIGCAVGTAIMAAGTFTGGFMNPLIALGPAILSRDFTNHWIYWIGPYVGVVPAVIIHKLFVWIKERHERLPTRVIPPSADFSDNLPFAVTSDLSFSSAIGGVHD